MQADVLEKTDNAGAERTRRTIIDKGNIDNENRPMVEAAQRQTNGQIDHVVNRGNRRMTMFEDEGMTRRLRPDNVGR